MKIRSFLLKLTALTLLLFCIVQQQIAAQIAMGWKEIRTVEDVCTTYPDVIKKMLNEFNLSFPGLEGVRQAVDTQDIELASERLLDYYKNCENARRLRREQPVETSKTVALADTILKNVFVIQNVRGEVPFGNDGHRDWYYKGPNDDREWAWLSNRHSQIDFILSTYFETGNPKYAEYIDLFLRDFIIKSMPYPGVKSSTSVWRGLEVAARVKVWSRLFYGLTNSSYLSPATRLLMLSSLPDHAHYNRNFHSGNNWLTMEISALATVATNFPEFRDSEEWLDYSVETMVESMRGQVYADGVQTELTSHYHNVALRNFELFKEICDGANKELPYFFNQTLEKMYSYIAHVVRPDGHRILNNDGDRGSDRELILEGAEKFNNEEWKYVATNGEKGTLPSDGPSYLYPWAGQLISRSGYDADAHWSFFDIGPWGSGHQHNDKMHISISAYGRDLLVDGGRFAYSGEVAGKFRRYATGSQSHNVVLIDGKGQAPGPRLAAQSLREDQFKITPDFDYAWGVFDGYIDLEGRGTHSRALFYVRNEYWIVVDRVSTSQPRKIEVLWHWHPDCEVETRDKGIVYTNNKRGNLSIIPVGKQKWGIAFVKGQEQPEIQGWYSEEYNKFTLNIASVYTTNIKSDKTFVWLLYPSEGTQIDVDAKIIGETSEAVEVQVKDRHGKIMNVTIPFSDSSLASIKAQ
jgi:hypothetical protein